MTFLGAVLMVVGLILAYERGAVKGSAIGILIGLVIMFVGGLLISAD